MLERGTIIQLISIAVLVVCLGLSGVVSTALTVEAGKAQLVYTDEAEEGDPPEVALGIALGAFRGIFVNYLWIRANKLKEEGKFYDAIQLSETITRLQPRFPRVWVFHAWNMSYNISVATHTAEERWQWVDAGINLLRSQAIPRNPNDVLLHKELAWIFVHKVQGFTDDANHYYKQQIARRWSILLGPPPERSMDPESQDLRDVYVAWLTPLLTTPTTIEGVIERELKDQREAGVENPTSRVSMIVERVRSDARMEFNEDFLRLYELRRAYNSAWYTENTGKSLAEQDRNEVLDELIADEANTDAWTRLLPFVRRRVITSEYNMQPSRMIEYTKRYGPLDWRHPAVHGLYWALKGVEEATDRTIRDDFNALNTDRTAIHAAQEIWRSGDVEYDLLSDEYFALPNFAFTDMYGQLIESIRDRAGGVDDEKRAFRLYSEGYQNFLTDVIRVYYRRGWLELAQKYLSLLRNAEWINLNDSEEKFNLSLPLKEFVLNELKQDRINVPHVAVSEIESALYDAFLEGLYKGDGKLFRNSLRYAKKAWEEFTKEQVRTTAAEELRMIEYVGENFSVIVNRTLVRLLLGGEFGTRSNIGRPSSVGRLQAGELYRKLPLDMQLAVYDDLLRAAQTRGGMNKNSFDAIFPAPPGIEEWRARVESNNEKSDRAIRKQLEFETQ